jgi:hypothetical protein
MYIGGFYGSKSNEVLKRKYDMLVEEGVQFESSTSASSQVATVIRVRKTSVASSI